MTDFLRNDLTKRLAGVDAVFANCGPIAALLFQLREALQLKMSIYREVRTLGWVGYAFQEFVAHALQRPHDRCLHVSDYAARVWAGIRRRTDDRVFYPMLRKARTAPAEMPDRTLRCGYFSRISADKGIAYLPAIVRKLRDCGWPVEALTVSGASAEPGLLDRCRVELATIGVTLTHLGELGYSASLDAIASVDIVLFPSVSSVEAGGRVVLEAYNLGKHVIASDYCWGADMLQREFRIPLSLDTPVSGTSTSAFAIADLAVESWTAPVWKEECFEVDTCESFRYHAASVEHVLSACANAPYSRRPPPIEMRFDWDSFRSLSAMAWCERVYAILEKEYRDRGDLLDLGGAFKRSLHRAGFEPSVCFQPAKSVVPGTQPSVKPYIGP